MTPTYLETNTGPFSVSYQCYPTAEAFDRDAGEIGACVTEANFSLAFRSTKGGHPKFHEVFTPILEELSGITREVNKKATAQKKKEIVRKDRLVPILESFITFANRAKAIVLLREGGEQLWSEIEAKALEVSKTLRIDAKPQEKVYPFNQSELEKAKDWLTNAEPDFVNERIEKYSSYIGGFKLDREPNGLPSAENLARLMTAYLKERAKEVLHED